MPTIHPLLLKVLYLLYNPNIDCVHISTSQPDHFCYMIVFILDGYTYKRSAIMSWFMEGNRRSQTTNITLPNTTLFPN